MARVTPLLSSLNSGELSPRMEARVDFARYPNAAKRLRNGILLPQGGFARRPGTRYVAETKDSSKTSRLFPFQYSEEDAYQIESGDEYMRFFRRQGQITVADTDAAVTNGTFASNINDWDDASTSAFPSSETSAGSQDSSSASLAATLPSDIQSGDLLFIFVTVYHTFSTRTISTPSGWTELYNVVGSGNVRRAAGYYRTADGTEGSTVTVNVSGTSDISCLAHRVTGWSGTPEATTATGSSSPPNPPSGTASWGSARNLWFAVGHMNDETFSGAPDGYSGYVRQNASGNGSVATGWKKVETATENPGAFVSGNTSWAAAVVAIQPSTSAIQHDATNGRLKIPALEGETIGAQQDISVGASYQNNEHVLRFSVEGPRAGSINLQIGTSSGGSEVLSLTECGVGEHSIAFTPGATTFYVQFYNQTVPGMTMYIDDVSILDNAALEVTSPYDETELADINAYQTGNYVYLLHGSYPTRRLVRRGHKSWSLEEAFFADGPYLPSNNGLDISNLQRVINPLFEDGLDGWEDASSGDAYVNHNDASKIVELDPGTSGGSGDGTLRTNVSLQVGLKVVVHFLVLGAGPVDLKIGTSSGGSEYYGEEVLPGWHSYSLVTTASSLFVEFGYQEYTQENAAIGACLIYDQSARLLEPSGVSGEVTVTAYGFSPFTSADVGRLIRLVHPGKEPGYGIITAYSSATSVTVQVVRDFGAAAPTEEWYMGAWGGSYGYPKVMGFFDGRSVFANTAGQPKTLWFSQSGDIQNMRPDSYVEGGITVEDDDAIAKTLNSQQVDPVLWFNGKTELIVGTAGGQWAIDSVGAVVTPSDTSTRQQTAVPAGDVNHVAINDITIFTDRSKRELHDIGYKDTSNSFVATDLTILADHVFRSRVAELAYQRRPYSSVWARRADGRLAVMAYNQQHDILGWSQVMIGGSFGSGGAVVESISVIPGAEDSNQVADSDERDELWMIVKRTIDGSTVRYVEFMEGFFDGPLREDYDTEAEWRAAVLTAQEDAFYLDCGLTYDGAATDTLTGAGHLEGQTVTVLANGKVLTDRTVSGGQVSVPSGTTKAHVGLAYTHKYESLKLAVGAQGGTSVHKAKAVTSVGLVLLDTADFKITTVEYDRQSGRRVHDLHVIDFRRDGDDPTAAQPLYTGETSQPTESSHTGDPRIYCEGDAPLPFSLIGLAPVVETVEGSPARR